ncbi:MAG: ATP-binding protein [Methylococcales bacterium]|nr:ATP-binding protein [Methylococcales bacterium]
MKKISTYYPHHSLKARLVVLTLLFLLLPTGILGYLGYDYLYDTIKASNIRAVGHIADARHEQLNIMLKNTNDRAEHFLQHLPQQCEKRDKAKVNDCFKQALQIFINNEQAISATLSDANGLNIHVGNTFVPDITPFQTGQLVGFSAPEKSVQRLYYIVKENEQGERLTVTFPISAIQQIFVSDPSLGESGDVFIMDSQGFFITYPHLLESQDHSNETLEQHAAHLSEAKNDHAMQHCLMMGNAEMLDIDRRGVEIIHSFRFVPEVGGGCIMAHLDQAEAFATLNALQWRVIWITIGLVIFALMIALMVGKNIVKPIDKLCAVTHQIINGNYAISAVVSGDSEIAALANAFNLMTERLKLAFDELNAHRTQLEHKVQKRTEQLLIAKNEAEQSLTLLQETQESLVQAEKMAALGGLVAGVAHEINTPIGITLTSASFLSEETSKVMSLYQQGELGGDELEAYFDNAKQSTELMTMNCHRAADLIQSFKQVAVDQTSDNQREFNLKSYLEEVLVSLRPALKNRDIRVELDCPDDLMILGFPGAISQIVTNFIMNSLTHGYDKNQQGIIKLHISDLPENKIEFRYSDDGKGIPSEIQSKIFDPFFTTQRGNGGSGLGLNLVYNIVHQTLKGLVQVHSVEGEGTTFTIHFPKES